MTSEAKVSNEATDPAEAEPLVSEAKASAEAVETGVDGDAVETLKASLEQAEQRMAELEDRALRAAAEAENVRRRADRSIENARKFALEKFVDDLLPAVDSFERAVEAADEDASGNATAMAEGLGLSLKLLADAMSRQGIEVVDPIGAPFDPTLHEAMTVVDNAEAEPDSVIQVFQKGYTVNGRLIRPARVIVARQPPVAAEQPPVVNEPPPAEPSADA